MKTLIAVYSSNNSANGLKRIYHLFCLFFLLIFILFNLLIALLWLGVTFRVVKTILYVLHRILGLYETICSIKTRVAPLCVANDDKSNGV